MQRGDLAAAEAEAKLALEDSSTQPVAYALLGSIRLRQDRYEQGAELLERAVEADPNLVGARLNLAQAYEALVRGDQAEAQYRAVLQLVPESRDARFALMRAESRKGRHRQALELAGPVEDQLRASPDGLVLLASALSGAGEAERARGLLPHWIELGEMPEPWTVKFALALAAGGLHGEAIQLLERFKREERATFLVAFNLAGFYLLERDKAKAAENYDLALQFDDRSVPALRQAARLAKDEGEYEKALAFLIRAKLEAPADPEVLFAFGTVCLRLELLEDSANALRRAHELRPDHRSTRYWLAVARGANGDYDESLALYQGLLRDEPESAQLQYAVGTAYYLKAEFEDAALHLQESVRLDPDQLMSPYYLARVAQKQGRDREAIRRFEAILERRPEHGPSHEGLAMSLFKERRYEAARRSFEQALALDPDSLRANYQLGQLLVRMGLREEAKEQLALADALREDEESRQVVKTLLNPH